MYRNKNRHSEVETTFAQLEELQRLKCHNFVTEELLKTDINNKKKKKSVNAARQNFNLKGKKKEKKKDFTRHMASFFLKFKCC